MDLEAQYRNRPLWYRLVLGGRVCCPDCVTGRLFADWFHIGLFPLPLAAPIATAALVPASGAKTKQAAQQAEDHARRTQRADHGVVYACAAVSVIVVTRIDFRPVRIQSVIGNGDFFGLLGAFDGTASVHMSAREGA